MFSQSLLILVGFSEFNIFKISNFGSAMPTIFNFDIIPSRLLTYYVKLGQLISRVLQIHSKIWGCAFFISISVVVPPNKKPRMLEGKFWIDLTPYNLPFLELSLHLYTFFISPLHLTWSLRYDLIWLKWSLISFFCIFLCYKFDVIINRHLIQKCQSVKWDFSISSAILYIYCKIIPNQFSAKYILLVS